MLTNRLNLPAAIVNAVKNDPYTRGSSDISVTQLIQPPYQRKLRAENEVIEDVADRIWSLVGQVGHGILERSYPKAYAEAVKELSISDALAELGVVAERRLFHRVDGWTLSGQFDLIERLDDGRNSLKDFKFTTVWATVGETKIEWVRQLNVLRFLAHQHGVQVDDLGIIAILRDWSKAKAKTGEYAPQQVVPIEIPIWSMDETEAYIRERIKLHQEANPPVCSDEERWKKPDVFAVTKDGRKRAIKLYEVREEAEAKVAELGKGHNVETRPGGYTRCQDYCNVSHLCEAMQKDVEF